MYDSHFRMEVSLHFFSCETVSVREISNLLESELQRLIN